MLNILHGFMCVPMLILYNLLYSSYHTPHTLHHIGISMEGGCYPRGGSDKLAKELVPVIESYGGRVLIRAQVEKILFESKTIYIYLYACVYE